jgi:recombination protein RecA
MSSALSDSLNALKKLREGFNINDLKVFKPNEQLPVVSTGSIVVNHLIGGEKIEGSDLMVCPGIPRSRLTEIFGGEGSGKTTLATSTAVEVQKAGGCVGYLDYENAYSDGYAQKIGLVYDRDYLQIFTPSCLEDGLNIILAWIKNNVDLIIVDSVSAMVPRIIIEGAQMQIGLQARILSQYMGVMTSALRNSRSAVIFLNQMRSRIKKNKFDFGPDEDTSGGKSIKFYASLRLKLDRRKMEHILIPDPLTGKEMKKTLGVYTRVTAIKNKLSSHQGDSGEIFIRYGRGVDNIRTMVDIGIERDVIHKGGAWFSYESSQDSTKSFKVQGKEAISKIFAEDLKLFSFVQNDVLAEIDRQNRCVEEIDTTKGTIVSEDVADDLELDEVEEVEEE